MLSMYRQRKWFQKEIHQTDIYNEIEDKNNVQYIHLYSILSVELNPFALYNRTL